MSGDISGEFFFAGVFERNGNWFYHIKYDGTVYQGAAAGHLDAAVKLRELVNVAVDGFMSHAMVEAPTIGSVQ